MASRSTHHLAGLGSFAAWVKLTSTNGPRRCMPCAHSRTQVASPKRSVESGTIRSASALALARAVAPCAWQRIECGSRQRIGAVLGRTIGISLRVRCARTRRSRRGTWKSPVRLRSSPISRRPGQGRGRTALGGRAGRHARARAETGIKNADFPRLCAFGRAFWPGALTRLTSLDT